MTHVLIVDDQEDNRYLLRALLQGHGFSTEEAGHGAQALAFARQRIPDLVISDLLMPVLDGYNLLRHWKGDEALRAIPFIVYTATYTEPRDEQLALSLGADAFIVKPAEPEPLLARIRQVLATREQVPKAPPPDLVPEEAEQLAEYSRILVRKLEKKAEALEQSNRELREEIAERNRIESALRDSEERYRSLFYSFTDPLFVYDRESLAYLTVNDAAVALYGYSHEEFLQMTIKDIRPPEDVPKLLDMLASSGTKFEKRGVWRHRKKDGTIINVEITAHGIQFAGRPACIAQARDVSERQAAEEKLRLRDRAIEAVSQGIVITDPQQPNSPIIYASHGFELMTGYAISDVLGKDLSILHGPETDRHAIDELLIAIDDRRQHSVEVVYTRKDGTPFWSSLSISPIRDDSGATSYFVAVLTDITERMRLEEQLRQAQKMEAVGRLAGGVAHDFNNLLTIISGYSEVMLGMPELNATAKEFVKSISQAGERAASLTRQLLAFSRKTMLQPEVLDLNLVIGETSKMLRRLIGEDIQFTTVLAANLEKVKVDPGQLDQVLMNLAVNARDAMPRGGRLTIETSNITLTDEYAATQIGCAPGKHVMLAISDTGCGMSPDVTARIFEPFFTTKEAGKGTGLGLAMVFGIVRQSGGQIHVYSEIGRGSTFKIYFPAVMGETKRVSDRAPNGNTSGDETILLVEDEEGVRSLAQSILEQHGYHVLAARDGVQALQIAIDYSGPIDLLLTDVVMPGLSGPELTQRLLCHQAAVKVLYMSGYTDDAVVRHGLLTADVSFIQKPYTPASLARKVRLVLDDAKSGTLRADN